MGIAYAAKAPAATPTTPPTWPPSWDWPPAWYDDGEAPSAWPPGWPLEIEEEAYSLDVSLGTIAYGLPTTVTCTVLDDADEDTDDLDGHIVAIAASVGGELVQVRWTEEGDWADFAYMLIDNYSGTHYGFSEDLLIDLDAGDVGETLILVCAVATVSEDVTGTDNGEVVGANLVFTAEPSSVTRGVAFTLTVQVKDDEGNVLTDLAPETTLTLTSPDANDVLSDTTIAEGDWSSGVWTDATLTISGGSGTDSGAKIKAEADGYDSDETGAFSIADPILTPSLTTCLVGHSYQWFSGVYTGLSEHGEAGWQAEWDEAHDPTVDAGLTGISGTAGATTTTTRFLAALNHFVEIAYGSGVGAHMYRRAVEIDISSIKGIVDSAVLRVLIGYVYWKWGISWWANGDLISIAMYSHDGTLDGTASYEKFNNILTNAAAGTLEDSKTFTELKAASGANGYVDFDVSADTINSATGDTITFLFLIDTDFADTPQDLPGNDKSYVVPDCSMTYPDDENAITLRVTPT